jgi:putative hemolysin
MPETCSAPDVFKLENPFSATAPLRRRIFSMMEWPVERLLLFHRLNRAYRDVAAMRDRRPFVDKALERLNVRYEIADEDLQRLAAAAGPVIVVANHPFGGIEGMILASLLRSVRCDVKLMANYLLQRIPEMREHLIGVDPFGRPGARLRNITPLRQSIRWVKDGGMLVVFPSGEVSHFDPLRGALDPPWSETIGRIVRKTGAPVLPVYFSGTNSMLFHAAGMLHPLLRTARLPGELLNKGKHTIGIAVGRLLDQRSLKTFAGDGDLTEHLRLRTYLLAHRRQDVRPVPAREEQHEPVEAARRPGVLEQEIAALGSDRLLAASGDLSVHLAAADEAPSVLFEIGRLREHTFRAVGEGTGREIDIDRFDEHYLHLFLWDRNAREIAGAYRIGRADDLLALQGIPGLYTSTLFSFDPSFFERLGPALELGRSFVRPEYQKSYGPLLLLWKGIGSYLVRNPRYTTLFGPVSISNDYRPLSRQLIAQFLEARRSRPDLAGLVRPLRPFRIRRDGRLDRAALKAALSGEEQVSDLVADIERDGKGLPVLLRQYFKLGGSIAGLNVDPSFGNALDGLIIVDLLGTDRKVLERYLGKEGAATFLRRRKAGAA